MATRSSPEVYLISAILRTGDITTALQAGIDAEQFHACRNEWTWLTDYLIKHRKVPSKVAFRQQFPAFTIKAVDDVGHYTAMVRSNHARRELTKALRTAADMLAVDDIDAAVAHMHHEIVSISASMGSATDDSDIITNWEDTFKEVSGRVERVGLRGMAGIPTGFTTLDERTGGPQPGHIWVVAARLNVGKMARNSTLVSTPNGWKRHGDLVVGDTVTGSDGRPTKVIATYPHYQERIYRVTFRDGRTVDCGADHLWTTRCGSKPWKVRTTAEIMQWLADGKQRLSIPTLSGPVRYHGEEQRTHSLYNPYLMGLLLGDGHLGRNGVTFTKNDPELVEGWGRNAVLRPGQGSRGDSYYIRRLVPTMERYGLIGKRSWEKFIPEVYKFAGPGARHALLQGLLDTDGGLGGGANSVEYSTTSDQLAYDVREIVESLGGYATMHRRQTYYTHNGEKRAGRPSWRMIISLPNEYPPFRLKRKADGYKPYVRRLWPSRSIVSVEALDEYEDMQCITVDNPDSLYCLEGGILTHNSWAMMRMATAAIMDGYAVQYNALEQTRADVSMRIHTFLSGSIGKELFRNLDLSQGRNFDLDSYKAFLKGMKDHVEGRLHVSDTSRGRVSPLTIAAQIERNRPDIVFIDYLTLMEKTGTGDWLGQPLDTPIPTPEGWSTMGDLAVGDKVFDHDGKPCTVIGKSPIWTDRETYKITFDDGETAYCDGEHEWVFEIVNGRRPHKNVVTTMRTDEAIDYVWTKERQPRRRLRIANTKPLDLPAIELPVGPYTLGVWLGDGTRWGGFITKQDDDLFTGIEAEGYTVKPRSDKTQGGRRVVGLTDDLKAAHLIKDKRIPKQYLRASIQQRLALLQGLMDTDGTWNRCRDQAVFTNKNRDLAEGVAELVRSLGWKPRIWRLGQRKYGENKRFKPTPGDDVIYDVTFTPFGMNPFRMKRKAALVRLDGYLRSRRRTVKAIEKVEHIDTVCIGVDSPSHTYLTGYAMIPTHNSVAKLSADVKEVAMRYNIPIVVASQLNRERGIAKRGEPVGAEAISQSDAVGQDADAVVTMAPVSKSVLAMKLVKYRHGLAGFKWFTQFQPSEGVFKEISHDKAMTLKDQDDDQEDNT